jgi:arylsulfatase
MRTVFPVGYPVDHQRRAYANIFVRPHLHVVKGDRQLVMGGVGRLRESSILNIHNKSHTITADVVLPTRGAEGVIIAIGGIIGGWSLYAKRGRLKYCYNFFGLAHQYVESGVELPAGRHQVRMDFTFDPGDGARGGTVTLNLNGRDVGTGRIDRTEAAMFSTTETCDIGTAYGSPVTTDYDRRQFTGRVNWVELAIGRERAGSEQPVQSGRLHVAELEECHAAAGTDRVHAAWSAAPPDGRDT